MRVLIPTDGSAHRVGHPRVVIADWAEEHDVDLVIMGSHGRTALQNLLFGSVTQFVLAASRVPVLVPRTPQAPQRESLRVGIAVDGSRYGEAAADFVLAQRALFGPQPEITLLHAADTRVVDLLPTGRLDEGLTLPTAALLGSVAWSVAAKCSTPLLLIRLPR